MANWKKVIPVDDYVLSIVFDNGECGNLDMINYLYFGVFARLKDMETFRQVRVSFDRVEWDAGIDLDPEFVYAKSQVTKNAFPGSVGDFQGAALL